MDRRKFIINTSLATAALIVEPGSESAAAIVPDKQGSEFPLVISTWDFGFKANEVSWQHLENGQAAVDAVEQGIRVIEADPDNLSVGIGGLPDRDGFVTLDACIMDDKNRAGSVTFLQEIMHPISVARLVMDKTPHVMLSGEGALQFALENGFERQNLLTDKAKQAWEEWKIKSKYKPVINIENHDTVGLLAIDQEGTIAGGCSTSGLAYKMHGRVGDSPIIGAGLFVDNEVGACVATGLGEMVMRTLSAFLVVELMRNRINPQEACEEAIRRIVKRNPDFRDFQVAVIAVNKNGNYGAYAIQPGFRFAIRTHSKNELVDSESFI